MTPAQLPLSPLTPALLLISMTPALLPLSPLTPALLLISMTPAQLPLSPLTPVLRRCVDENAAASSSLLSAVDEATDRTAPAT